MGGPYTAEVTVEFFSRLMQLAAEMQRLLTGHQMTRCGSRCLAWAVEAGLPPQMCYSVSETAKYSGVSKATLRAEHDAGRLAFVIPEGQERGAVIEVEEMDRWIAENTR